MDAIENDGRKEFHMGDMMKVAVLDDMREDALRIKGYLEQFQTENNMQIDVQMFYSGMDFLEEYKGEYDVLFLDIEMPGINGMDVAREIRKSDEAVGIIFVTSMMQYAIEGYEVNAIDFMVKPISYYSFSVKLDKAMRFFRRRREKDILIENKDGMQRMSISDLIYIEKDRDYVVFHTKKGTVQERGTIRGLKEKLEGFPFAESMAGCLVNLKYVKRIDKDTATLSSGDTVLISRRQKADFLKAYIEYMGGGIG